MTAVVTDCHITAAKWGNKFKDDGVWERADVNRWLEGMVRCDKSQQVDKVDGNICSCTL